MCTRVVTFTTTTTITMLSPRLSVSHCASGTLVLRLLRLPLPPTPVLTRAYPQPHHHHHFPRRHCYSTTALAPEKTRAPPTPPLLQLKLKSPNTGHIDILLLNAPQSRNALSTALLASLHQYLEPLSSTSKFTTTTTTPTSSPPTHPRALILASSCPTTAFCAGADLKERATFTPDQTKAFLSSLRSAFISLERLPIPTIAAINGPALGGGLEMALAADFRVMGPTALVGLPETRLAIIPGAGGTYRLPRVIGEHKALDMVLTGRRVGPQDALDMGLATRVALAPTPASTARAAGWQPELEQALRELDPHTAYDPALEAAVALAWEICSGGPIAIRAAKEAVRGWRHGEAVENAAYHKVIGTKDRDEALRAFREKRLPRFTGE